MIMNNLLVYKLEYENLLNIFLHFFQQHKTLLYLFYLDLTDLTSDPFKTIPASIISLKK